MAENTGTSVAERNPQFRVTLFRKEEAQDSAGPLEELSQWQSANGPLCILNGYVRYILGDYSRAGTAYRKALYELKEDHNPDLWYCIGQLYIALKNRARAEPALLAVLRIDPEYPYKARIYYELGEIFRGSGKTDLALKYLRRAVEAACGDPKRRMKSLCRLGRLYEEQNLMPKALASYELAHKEHRGPRTLGCLAAGYIKLAKYDAAIVTLSGELKGEHSAALKLLLVLSLMRQEKHSEAAGILGTLQGGGPQDYLYCFARGLYCGLGGEKQGAAEAFAACTRICSGKAEAWVNLAVAASSAGDRAAALNSALEVTCDKRAVLEKKFLLENSREVGAEQYLFPEINPLQLFFGEHEVERTRDWSVLSPIVVAPAPVSPVKSVAPSHRQVATGFCSYMKYLNVLSTMKPVNFSSFDVGEIQAIQILSEMASVPLKRPRVRDNK